MQPIDYTSAFANLESPQEAMMAGIKNGVVIRQVQDERAAAETKQVQAAQLQADLAALSLNPTTDAIGRMSVKYPHLSEGFKRSFDMLDPVQKQAKLDHASQVYAALQSGAPDVAQKVLTDQATALRNSGNEKDAKAAETMAALIKDHPEFAKTTAGLMISSAMGPDKFAEAFAKLGDEQRAQDEAPFDLDKKKADADAAKSDAEIKAVTAKHADSQALADLAKKQWDVRKIVADIEFQKESNRISAMNAAAAREGNALKKQELQLKIEEAITARDDKLRGKVADVESAASNIDNMLNTIDRILNVAEEKANGTGTGAGTSLLRAATGPLDSRLPTMQGDVADLEAHIETLGSQSFLSQLPNIKGMGQLSNTEGDKLQSAFQNFNLRQSDKQLISNLKEGQRLLRKGRATLSKRYGVPLGAPDTPAAAPAGQPSIDSFFR